MIGVHSKKSSFMIWGGGQGEWKKGDLLVQVIDDDDLDCYRVVTGK